MLLHIMPASAPIGVNSAPRLEPITVANTAGVPAAPPVESIIDENSTLIGILLIKLEAKNEAVPYFKTGRLLPNSLPISAVTPCSFNTTISTNIDSTNGTN